MPSVASAAAVVVRRGVAHRVAVVREAPPRVTRAVVAVVPAVMTMVITTHRAVVVEVAEDNFCFFGHKTDKTFKTIVVGTSNGSQPLAVATPD